MCFAFYPQQIQISKSLKYDILCIKKMPQTANNRPSRTCMKYNQKQSIVSKSVKNSLNPSKLVKNTPKLPCSQVAKLPSCQVVAKSSPSRRQVVAKSSPSRCQVVAKSSTKLNHFQICSPDFTHFHYFPLFSIIFNCFKNLIIFKLFHLFSPIFTVFHCFQPFSIL